jgi:hypothetical protein
VLIEDAFLMGENLTLVEEPHVVVGQFEPQDYLELPERVILEVAKGHQRYFGIRLHGGKAPAQVPRGREHGARERRRSSEGQRQRDARAPRRRAVLLRRRT